MSLPLIFFHKNFEPYLAFTLWQARQTNPRSPVYLLGDDNNDLSSLGVQHRRYRDQPGPADEFIAAYQHLSGHQLEYERLCFERWFYLHAFLEQTGIEEFCFLDSDFFLLLDLQELRPGWTGYEMAGAPAWAFCWFGNRGIIGRFCRYMLERFRDPQQVAAWASTYRAGAQLHPVEAIFNVSDMLLWMMFIRDQNIAHLDLRIPRNGMIFDHLITWPNGFVMRNGLKQLSRRGNQVFGVEEQSRRPVRFAGLHLGGKYPKRLVPVFTGWPAPVVRACCRPPYVRNLRRLMLVAAHSFRRRGSFFQPLTP